MIDTFLSVVFEEVRFSITKLARCDAIWLGEVEDVRRASEVDWFGF